MWGSPSYSLSHLLNFVPDALISTYPFTLKGVLEIFLVGIIESNNHCIPSIKLIHQSLNQYAADQPNGWMFRCGLVVVFEQAMFIISFGR